MADGEKMQYVPLPDGSYLELPEGMKDEEVNAVLAKNAGKFGLPEAKQAQQPEGDSFWRQAAGTVGRQITGAVKASVAPYTEAYKGYREGQKAGLGTGTSLAYGAARGVNQLLGDPLSTGERFANAPEEYRERREAGYGPLYSALAPHVAPQVGVNLEEMERQAALGHPRGVLAEAAVPAGEAALPEIYRGLRGGPRRAPVETPEPLRELPRTTPQPGLAVPKVGLKDIGNVLEEAMNAPAETLRQTAEAQFEPVARRMFGKSYGALTPEQQRVVARNTGGGPPGGVERRITRGEGPIMERRAEGMPLPTNAPEAAGAPFTIETDSMGIRWAKAPGETPVSIPPRMTDPAEISRHVAELQARQRSGLQTLGQPKISSPGQPVAEPAPSQTLPRTSAGPPAAPPPTTLGGGRPAEAPRTLNEAVDLATGNKPTPLKPDVPLNEQLRRGQPSAEAKPPPEDALKTEFPDPAVRRLARANGAELLRSGAPPEAIQAVHDLTNVEVRQAAINSGIDVGQKHVGQRIGLGPEQISRQDLIDQMIKQGMKPEDIPRLARMEPGVVPYTKRMPIAKSRLGVPGQPPLLWDEQVHFHELAHAILGGQSGFRPEGIASDKHPLLTAGKAGGSAGGVIYDFGQFMDLPFRRGLSPAKLAGNIGQLFIDMTAAGAAADELMSGMNRYTNPGIFGDMNSAAEFFQALGYPRSEWPARWDAAIDRAAARLTPEVQAIMRHEATFREDNLPVQWHYSEARIQAIVDRIDEAHQAKAGTGNAPGVIPAGYRSGAQDVAAGESASAARTRQLPGPEEKLAPFKAPQNTYTFEVKTTEGNPFERMEISAKDLKEAWKKLNRQLPGGFDEAHLRETAIPKMGVPAKIGPQSFTDLPHVPDELSRHFTSDEMATAKARPILQKNFVKAYNALIPSLGEIKNMMRAGHGLGGWWDRYVDALEAMGAHNEAADMKNLPQTHAEALKAFHGAVSGNKAIEQANIIAWGAYRDWLRDGMPTDRPSINRIVKANHGLSTGGGKIGLDTRKLYSLVNSPQFREGVPMTSDAWINSPVAGKSPGTQKIPSMVGTSAGPGGRGPENLMRTVIDRHILDLYGRKGMTDAQYLAISVHLRQAAEALGLAGRDGQGQGWGTVLGLKELRKQGMTAAQAAQAYSKDVLAGVGKDYAQTILDAAQKNKRVAQALEDLKAFGMDTGNPATMQRLTEIVQEGQRRMSERARPINRQLLQRSATRIWRMMKARPKKATSEE